MNAQEFVYDPFTGTDLSIDRWAFPDRILWDGSRCLFRDDNTQIQVGAGECRVTVNPYTRAHDRVQLGDNPKTLIVSRRRFEIPPGGCVDVEADLAAIGHNNDPDDLWDGFVTLNCLDRDSALIRDFCLNGSKVIALYERLYIPGVCEEDEYFTEFAEVARTEPGVKRRVRMRYDRASHVAGWYVDGELVYEATDLVDCAGFQIAMGLMTLKPVSPFFPYYFTRSTSNHGQGMTGIWGAMTVRTRG